MNSGKLISVVKDYANTVKCYLLLFLPPITESLKMMYQLKHQRRNGWNYNTNNGEYNRSVPHPESVSEHTDFCVRLAQIFLPDDSQVSKLIQVEKLPKEEYEKYSKSRIISMLSVHDLGEYLHGDIVRMEQKDHDRKQEHLALKTISSTTSCHISPLLADPYVSVYSPWREHNYPYDITINHKVSQDIDILECLAQLYLYTQQAENNIPDSENFAERLADNIKTEIGREILNIVIAPLSKITMEENTEYPL